MVARLTVEKGFDLLEKALDGLLGQGFQFVLLGTGEKGYEEVFAKMLLRYPGKVGIEIAFDESLAHKIIAGSDVFLLPSRYEPCGLTQMYSLRYGTAPIVRDTGGLSDTIEEFDQARGTGNGLIFGPYEVVDLLDASKRALDLFNLKESWATLMKNADGV